MNPLFLGLMATLCFLQGFFSFKPQNQWPKITQNDLKEVYQIIKEKYPQIAHTDKNSPLKDWLSTGCHKAIDLSTKATSIKGYEFALRYYLSGFHDPKLQLITNDETTVKWPGFLVKEKDNALVVATTAENAQDENIPPSNAQLIACNGKDPEELLKANIELYFGQNQDSKRLAPYLLVDLGNPYSEQITECTFKTDNGLTTIPLTWKPIETSKLVALIKNTCGNYAFSTPLLQTPISTAENKAQLIVPLPENRAQVVIPTA
ncbi:MAG: hypothetical protein WDZ41_05425 [Candidatus Babeliales bacterium]